MSTTTMLEIPLDPQVKRRLERAAEALGLGLGEFAAGGGFGRRAGGGRTGTQGGARHRAHPSRERAVRRRPPRSATARPRLARGRAAPAAARGDCIVTAGRVFVPEPLDRRHDRAAFSCGVPALDDYLRRQARQDRDRSLAAPFVLADPAGAVADYYTLSAASVSRDALPPDLGRRLGHYRHFPATLIGRLAVDPRYRGLKLGEAPLLAVLARALRQAPPVAATAAIVDALGSAARHFYERFDFIPLTDDAAMPRLFLPTATIAGLPLPEADAPITV
mgnify:CR=1 FL=1